jgi:hypothetical protein
MRLLLWHVHGSWTNAFVQGRHEYLLPVIDGDSAGRAEPFWPNSVREVTADQIDEVRPDLVILQRPGELPLIQDWLGAAADRTPLIYLEHNTPGGPAATSRHPFADRDDVLLVHVTAFNALMWDVGSTRSVVIGHGIADPGYRYTGELERQAVLINEAARRGRTVGADLLPVLAEAAPIDLYGIDCELYDQPGVTPTGDLATDQLHTDMARRRVYLHTSRWTSLGLSLIEAMHLGMPVVALGTTETPVAVPPEAGLVSNDLDQLLDGITMLIKDPDRARRMGEVGRAYARDHFGLHRFLQSWDDVLGSWRAR